MYGFVLYLLSNSLLLLYFAWALLPDSYLQVRHREINMITFTGSLVTGTGTCFPGLRIRIQIVFDPHYSLEADPDPELH